MLPYARFVTSALLALTFAATASAGPRPVTGHVVDGSGRPVAGADVSTFWSFDGGKARAFQSFASEKDGSFSGSVNYANRPVALMAFDADRKRGGIVVLDEKTIDEPAVIEIGSLVDLHGTITCEKLGHAPEWTNVYMMLVPSRARIASCSSTEARFDLRLPPGEYTLWAYGRDITDRTETVTLDARDPDHDLGAFAVEPSIIAMHYGKAPPRIHVTDARGVSKNVRLADYKGRWLLLEFWGYW